MGMRANRYAPLSAVTVVCGWMSAGPLNVTETPGMTAPVVSETFPKISPVLTCALADNDEPATARQRNGAMRRHALTHPPWSGFAYKTGRCPATGRTMREA